MIRSLNLGSGPNWPRRTRTHDEVFLDCLPMSGVDVVHDLNVFPWPFEDNSFHEIVALHLIEHLDDFLKFHDECWRILVKGGALYVSTPDAVSAPPELLWSDPTHKRPYTKFSYSNYMIPSESSKFHYTNRLWAILDLRVEDFCVKFHGVTIKD